MSRDQRKALELAREGDWHGAHAIVQRHDDALSCLIHAWLHRAEGDLGNAGYWYRRAGESLPSLSLDEELDRLFGLLDQ